MLMYLKSLPWSVIITGVAVTIYILLFFSWFYQKKTIHRLKYRARANQRFHIATSVAGLGVWEWDIKQDVLVWNPYLYQLYGMGKKETLTVDEWKTKLKQSDAFCIEQLREMAGNAQQKVIRLTIPEYGNRKPKIIELLACGVPGEPQRLIGTQRDISEAISIQQAMKQAAFEDKLTGLSNSRALTQRLQITLAEPPKNLSFGLMFIDLDGFKQINDTLGHDAGDELLQCAAKRMRSCMRLEDEVFRLGGDEFVIWIQLEGERSLQAEAYKARLDLIAAKLKQTLTQAFVLNGKTCFISASIGIACYPMDACNEQALLKYADTAMYRAKQTGKNQFIYYSDIHRESANSYTESAVNTT